MIALKKITLPLSVFLFVSFLLSMIQIKVERPMLLLERLFEGGGWIEILIVALFGAFAAHKMSQPKTSAQWRKIFWSIYSLWFFLQLLLGIFASDIFLLTGKLHLPIPAMMIAGPIYRGEKSIMTILFLSTILLTGPAWCSQLCYFGAIDNAFSKGKTNRKPIKRKGLYKHLVLLLVIAGALLARLLNMPHGVAAIAGISMGIAGLLVMVLFSRKKHQMIHCSLFCPIGTVVNYLRFINPFRMVIDTTCDGCLACTTKCKYDALSLTDIQKKKPGFTCTLCGDCLSACKSQSIRYKFLKLDPEKTRRLYLFLTISVYAVFLAMGRI
ncbi:MAG TPA: 4Fe-4S binding protein [Prolixibacteraceae bacterium]|nr:4Fe-4S binding protein [Prolixibacteraceae bacterium]HPS11734.1 4Fe-4S binding protein [Prolixibacteraceae bacterium]